MIEGILKKNTFATLQKPVVVGSSSEGPLSLATCVKKKTPKED